MTKPDEPALFGRADARGVWLVPGDFSVAPEGVLTRHMREALEGFGEGFNRRKGLLLNVAVVRGDSADVLQRAVSVLALAQQGIDLEGHQLA